MNSAALDSARDSYDGTFLGAVCDRILGLYWLILTLKSTVFFTLPAFQGMYAPIYPFLVLAALRGLSGRRPRLSAIPAISYYLFLLSVLVALLVSDVAFTVDTARRLFFYGFGAIAFLCCLRDACVRFLIAMQILATVVISGWVIYTAWGSGFGYRGGLDINWNYVSMVVASGVLALALYCYDHIHRFSRPAAVLGLFAFAAGVYSLVLLASRGTVVAVACALPFVAVGRIKKRAVQLAVGSLLLAAAAYGVTQLPGGQTLIDRALTDRVESLNFRLPIWEAILAEYGRGSAAEILVGRGIDAGEYLVGSTVVGLGTLHNGFLQVLFEEGLVGLCAFLGMHVWCLWRLAMGSGPRRQFAMVMVVYCIVANLSGSYEHLAEYWMVLAAAAAVSLRMKPRHTTAWNRDSLTWELRPGAI